MPGIEYISDFNCVTKWSIRDAKFTGPSLRDIIMKSETSPEAEWVMFVCADGYDTPIPFNAAIDDKSILALKIDDKPLGVKHGFPARPFMPSLYGWKRETSIVNSTSGNVSPIYPNEAETGH